jgi:hypothetical protein
MIELSNCQMGLFQRLQAPIAGGAHTRYELCTYKAKDVQPQASFLQADDTMKAHIKQRLRPGSVRLTAQGLTGLIRVAIHVPNSISSGHSVELLGTELCSCQMHNVKHTIGLDRLYVGLPRHLPLKLTSIREPRSRASPSCVNHAHIQSDQALVEFGQDAPGHNI